MSRSAVDSRSSPLVAAPVRAVSTAGVEGIAHAIAVVDAARAETGLHRRGGLTVLLLALAVVLVQTLMTPPGMAGRAMPAALPAPPEVGSCMVLAPRSNTVVPCAGPHDGEVVQSWAAGALSTAEFRQLLSIPFGDLARPCAAAAKAYLSRGGRAVDGGWTVVPPPFISRLVAAPAGERTADRGWTACVVGTLDLIEFVGSVRDGAVGSPRPAILGTCLTDGLPLTRVDCSKPHRIEVLAFGDATTDDSGVVPRQRSCIQLAADLTDAAEPTRGGRLRVAAESLSLGWAPVPFCFVSTVGGESLDGTVLGLGSRPLPTS